ncbi:alpha-glucan family phosphorylase [Candidatus Woesearchaeota archaeon]|nr:alpha-glucan family phosphorylase [Candidatus Woesearchaeota archaeon]
MSVQVATPEERRIAYFSMEIGLDESIPTYSGGLGILAGDTLKASADLGIPIVGITLLAEKGYFTQHLGEDGMQTESPTEWDFRKTLEGPLPAKVTCHIEGRAVHIQAWRHNIVGSSGSIVPVLFLDTNLEENAEQDRTLTSYLYGGDQKYRLIQEIILGIGGVRMLRALSYTLLNRYHTNEGHAAFLAVELLREEVLREGRPLEDSDECMDMIKKRIRTKCVFTTHTPVAAGHDEFDYNLVEGIIQDYIPIDFLRILGGKEKLNMTVLAMNLSHYVNSVARQHQHVSEHLFPGYKISNITNGVHSTTWTSRPFQELFDEYLPNWRQDSFELRNVLRIPETKVWKAHCKAKEDMVKWVNEEYGVGFEEGVFTIGFARRATSYKRADLLFHDIKRLRQIGKEFKLQIIYSGKAHPHDKVGKDLIKKIFWHMGELKPDIKSIFIPDYDMAKAKLIIPGVDLWLNTPMRPKEASGTSGMKAAHNGVPQLSILDGWWIEGHIEGVTGWELGPTPTEENENENDDNEDAEEMYDKLEHIILPWFYNERSKWLFVMRNAIAFNASFFNTHRMVRQYALNAYLL